jgi:L-asparagine oxygenase
VLTPGTRRAVPKTLDSGFGALLLENLPVDPVPPPTPGACGALEPDYKPTFVSEFVTVALGALAGAEIFNFRQEGRGSAPLLDNVVPVAELRSQRGAGGFEDNFPFHCESAWHRMRPDYVALVGIREDPAARTLVTSVTSILEQGLIARVPEDCFRLKPPQLYIEMAEQGVPLGTPPYRACTPIDARTGIVNVNLNGTDCLGDEAVQWLTTFEDVIEANAFSAVLGPGNALVMNNHRTCHTRTGFSPRLGPEARWFLRGNFKKNLWGTVPGSRPGGLSDADLKLLAAAGWSDEGGSLTASFLPFAEKPRQVCRLPAGMRSLAAKALLLTPVQGSRIV